MNEDTRSPWEVLRDEGPMFEHVPIRPPRQGFRAEQIFAERWKALMELPAGPDSCDDDEPPINNVKLWRILNEAPFLPSQRLASVLASVVCWFGTNCGLCFLNDARRIGKQISCAQSGFVAAWAIENVRKGFMNNGRTIMEHCLAREFMVGDHGMPTVKPPGDITAQDIEALNCFMVWLGKEEGREFLEGCERAVLAHQRGLTPADLEKLGVKP